MATSLIDQLARRLDLEPEEARDALSHLIAQVREQLDTQGNASVPGLGRFRTGPDGLTFEPDPALALAVNQRYAGLKPVTVGSASSTSFRKQEVVAPPAPTPEAPTDPNAPPEPPVAEPSAPDADDADLDAVLDDAERDTWYPPEPDDEDHPLGPASRPPYEEADFSVLAGFEETRRVDAEDELEPAPESTTPAAEEDAEDEPEPHPFDAEGEPETTEESAGPLPAVRLPVEGAPEPDFPEDPFADVVPEPEPLSPEPAPESSSPFFEEWTPSDFEAEEPEEDDATGETGELTPLTADIPEPTPDLEPEAEADLLEPAEPPAPVPPPPAPSRPLRAVHADRRDREPSRPLLPWILGGATVVILAALAWFWLIPALSGDGSPDPGAASPPITREEPVPPPSTTEMPTEDGQQPTENGEQPTGPDEAPPDPGPATTGPSQAGATSPATAAATPPTSTDAPATAIDRNAGVWTLVVASWTIRERAEQEMQRYANRLRAQGYPVDLLTETSGGVTRYRVAVGAFPDQNAAAQARERLGDAIPADTWILRVRPGM